MRIPSGIDGLDELIEGGLLSNRVYLISGSPGAGKTTFGLQFLVQGAKMNEIGLYITLLDSPHNIIEDFSSYSFDLNAYLQQNKILFADVGPRLDYGYMDELNSIFSVGNGSNNFETESDAPSPASVFKEIETYVTQYNVTRLVIDSLSAMRFTKSDRIVEEKEISRFIRQLKRLGCTTVLLSELSGQDNYKTEQYAAHGVIILHSFLRDDELVRALQIVKMRGTRHPCTLMKLEFSDNGLKVHHNKISSRKTN